MVKSSNVQLSGLKSNHEHTNSCVCPCHVLRIRALKTLEYGCPKSLRDACQSTEHVCIGSAKKVRNIVFTRATVMNTAQPMDDGALEQEKQGEGQEG